MSIYFRFLASFSITLINTLQHYPKIAPESLLLTLETEQPPHKTTLVSFDKHTHNHIHQYPVQAVVKIPLWRRGVFWTTIGTLGIGGFTAYYTKLQADAAIIQADAAMIQAKAAVDQVNAQVDNNSEMRRQNDLEAFSQGLFKKEEYCRRQPNDCTSFKSIIPPQKIEPQTVYEKHFPEAFKK
jgi:hypothetical protein